MKNLLPYAVALLFFGASVSAAARWQNQTRANVYNMIVSIQNGSR